MVGKQIAKILGERSLSNNARHYYSIAEHAPYFKLTPEGAKALLDFMNERSFHIGTKRSETEKLQLVYTVPQGELRRFFREKVGFSKNDLSVKDMYLLFGVASEGYEKEKLPAVYFGHTTLMKLSQSANEIHEIFSEAVAI